MAGNGMKTAFKNAKLVDFTGTVSGFQHLKRFDQQFIDMVRNCSQSRAVVIIDRSFAGKDASLMLVRDHLNLTGGNPLAGPNHPAGERFPVVQDIYFTDCLKGTSSGIAAELKEGAVPDKEELALLRSFGADFCCYNMAQAMLIAAHAKWKVLGIALPEGVQLSKEQLQEIQELTRG